MAQCVPPAKAAPPPADADIASAAEHALIFLALRQQSDGSIGTPESSPDDRVSMTSSALLAFLSAGHPPQEGRFGRVVSRMIDYLAAVAQPPPPQATTQPSRLAVPAQAALLLALSQSVGVEFEARRKERAAESMTRAVQSLVSSQSLETGAWSDPAGRPDVATSARALISLRAASVAGADVDPAVTARAAAFITLCLTPAGAFSDRPGTDPSPNTTAFATLALVLLAENPPPELPAVLGYLASITPTLAGDARVMSVLALQTVPPRMIPEWRPPESPAQDRDGAFAPPAAPPAERITTTASEVLTLTAPWRLLPGLRRVFATTPGNYTVHD